MTLLAPFSINGAWTFPTDPRAIVANGKLIVGACAAPGGDIIIAGEGDVVPTRAANVLSQASVNDHSNPAFIIRQSDQRIMALYCVHNGSAYYIQTSIAPLDGSAWAAPVDITAQLNAGPDYESFSYANPVQLDDGTIYVFFRAQTVVDPKILTMHYSKSTDGGSTWAPVSRLLWDGRPYTKVAKGGPQRIDFACNDGHPEEITGNSLYHFYMTVSGGVESFFKSNGVSMGSPPFAASAPTKVYNGSGPAGESWIYNIEVIGGVPTIVHDIYPSLDAHTYWQARFSGGVWTNKKICDAGDHISVGNGQDGSYAGGVCQSPDDIDVIYCSREISGIHQIFKYETADGGDTWNGTQLTSGAETCFRPYLAAGGAKVAYCVGIYTSWSDYATRIALLDV